MSPLRPIYDATSRQLSKPICATGYVVTLREPTGALAGFSTLAVMDRDRRQSPARDLSGDTIIDHAMGRRRSPSLDQFAGRSAWAPDLSLYGS